jgi:pseudouridine-5'-phosphate glycosidase
MVSGGFGGSRRNGDETFDLQSDLTAYRSPFTTSPFTTSL